MRDASSVDWSRSGPRVWWFCQSAGRAAPMPPKFPGAQSPATCQSKDKCSPCSLNVRALRHGAPDEAGLTLDVVPPFPCWRAAQEIALVVCGKKGGWDQAVGSNL